MSSPEEKRSSKLHSLSPISTPSPRRVSLPSTVFANIASFLGPRDQANLSGVSKAARAGVALANPRLSHITGSRQVGPVEMFSTHAPSVNGNQVFHPMETTGYQPSYPHLTEGPSGGHVTDVAALSQVRYPVGPGGVIGVGQAMPARDGSLIAAASGTPDTFVRKKDVNRDIARTLGPNFYEPVSPRSQRRALSDHDWTGKKVL